MRVIRLLAFAGLAAAFAAPVTPAADSPDALLAPLVPPSGSARVRVPLDDLPARTVLRAEVPHGKDKSKTTVATIALCTATDRSYVTSNTLARWGHSVAKDVKTFTLPELRLVDGVQVAPAVKGGRDRTVCLTGIALTVLHDAPEGDTVYRCDLLMSPRALGKGGLAKRAPRLVFADRFLELTVPAPELTRPGTSTAPVPEVTADPDANLVPIVAPINRGSETFVYAAVNGRTAYKLPNGRTAAVTVALDSANNWGTGVIMSVGLARGCQAEWDEADVAGTGVGVYGRAKVLRGKVKELRLGLFTDAALAKPIDLVLTDVPVVVDRDQSGGGLFIGPRFLAAHVKDAVYAVGTDGLWKLYGRCAKRELLDVSTRKKP